MDKYVQFLQLMSTLNFLVFAAVMCFFTGAFGVATNIWDKPTPMKTGFMCAIAFLFGAMAMFVAK